MRGGDVKLHVRVLTTDISASHSSCNWNRSHQASYPIKKRDQVRSNLLTVMILKVLCPFCFSEFHDVSATTNWSGAKEEHFHSSLQAGRKLQRNPVHNDTNAAMLESKHERKQDWGRRCHHSPSSSSPSTASIERKKDWRVSWTGRGRNR